MEETYYYSKGRRISVFRLRSARVVSLSEDREFVSVPGWRTLPLGNKGFQLLLREDAISERALQTFKLEELTSQLLGAEKKIEDQPTADEERTLYEEFGTRSNPALLGKEGGILLPTGEVVAKFNPRLDRQVIEREVQLAGGEIVKSLSFLPDAYLLKPMGGGDCVALANTLVESGVVEFASPNFIEEMPWRTAAPPNNLFSQQWHLNNTGQNGAAAKADVRALEAWQITHGSPDVVICVLDSGVDRRHEAFSFPGKLVVGRDFEDDDFIPDPTTSSHGTSCAGIAAAPWGVGRVVGIAPDCSLMPIRRATLSDHLKMSEAFVWAAENGTDIISCSFGHDHRPWILPDIVRAALDYALDYGRNGKGCVIFWAAGNGNEPISSDEWASYEGVIAVGASTDTDTRAPYSDYGPELDLCAPSSGGKNGVTTTAIGGYTNSFGGTSAAAPLAAGIAALILSIDPYLTWQQVRDILTSSADKIDRENGTYNNNGHSDLYGYGRVNALNALNRIPVLDGILRGSDIAHDKSSLIAFSTEILETRPAGRVILNFITQNRFRFLEAAGTSQRMRSDLLSVLRATIELYKAITTNRELRIQEEVWKALGRITSYLFR